MINLLPPRNDNTWIQTYTGRKIWPLNPQLDDIDIIDIAHGLSLMNRYTGHTKFPYSVAQHSIMMHDHLAAADGTNDDCLWALLHDASEAYLADVASPIKSHLTNYTLFEENLMRCIAQKFRLSWPMPSFIKHFDLVLLATERQQLMTTPPSPWHSIGGITALGVKIKEQPWRNIQNQFLDIFYQLAISQKAA